MFVQFKTRAVTRVTADRPQNRVRRVRHLKFQPRLHMHHVIHYALNYFRGLSALLFLDKKRWDNLKQYAVRAYGLPAITFSTVSLRTNKKYSYNKCEHEEQESLLFTAIVKREI